MRIIYLHQYFNTPDMPGSTRSYELAKRLVKNGHQVMMITSKRDAHQNLSMSWTNEDGIQVCWIPVSYSNKMGFLRRIISFISFSIQSAKVCLSINADLVFASSTPLTIAIPGIYFSKIKNKPLVFEVRDLWPEIPIVVGVLKSRLTIKLAKWLERMTYHNSAQIIALSEGMKEGVVRTGYPPEKVSVITNLSNLAHFSSRSISKKLEIKGLDWAASNPLVIYTGALGHVNDVPYLINVADHIKNINHQVKFVIIGEGVIANKIESISRELGLLNQSVFIIEPIQKSLIHQLYSRATIVSSLFVNLEVLWHNSANKFFDGLAAGKPIMINYSGWQREILEKNQAGFYVPHDDPEKGARILNEILKDRDRQKLMGESARQLAEEKFSIEVQFPKFENVLKTALN